MNGAPLISLVMPAFNAAATVEHAVDSVRAQTWTQWELLVVNDGSTDATAAVLERIQDPRIRVFTQSNQGVSAARNTALDHALGTFLCFLDADDELPPRSLACRAEQLLADNGLFFADGRTLRMDADLRKVTSIYDPSFRGEPFDELVRMSALCFVGNTWMIRRTPATDARFDPGLTHGEDLLYYLRIAHAGRYGYCNEPVLHYRSRPGSAMSDLDGQRKGYAAVLQACAGLPQPPSPAALVAMEERMRRILVRSYLAKGAPLRAWRTSRASLRPPA